MTFFLGKNKSDVHDLAMHLRELGVDMEQEDDESVFLGVTL